MTKIKKRNKTKKKSRGGGSIGKKVIIKKSTNPEKNIWLPFIKIIKR